MKKRVVSLIISAFIGCSCILTVMASSGLDLNVLRKGEDIQYTESNPPNATVPAIKNPTTVAVVIDIFSFRHLFKDFSTSLKLLIITFSSH